MLWDAPVEVCLERAKQRGTLDRIESEQAAFFERARAAYLQRAADAPERYRIIDAALPLAQVQLEITETLEKLLKRKPISGSYL